MSNEKKEYYDKYWINHKKPLNEHEIVRLAEILLAIGSVLKSFENEDCIEICDLGCGRGWLSNELSKFGKVTGVDLSEKGVELARHRWGDVNEFIAHDILTWRPGKKYDIVVSSEVVEHIKEKELYAETIKNILKPNGILIITTPNLKAKKNWDRAGMGQQIVEDWLSPKGLDELFHDSMIFLSSKTFIFDFCYNGIYRIISAPKLLSLLKKAKLSLIYDALREVFNLGLYQIYVARLKSEANKE